MHTLPLRPLGRFDDWSSGIRDAEAVIHLAGTLRPRRPDTYHTANVATVERCIDALAGSTVRRTVLLSYVGAHTGSANAYLSSKARAEQLLGDTATASVVLRSTFVYGDPDDIGPSFTTYQARCGGTVWAVGNGSQRLAPIHVDDLADVIVGAALTADGPTGIFEVSGPTVSCLDDFVRAINPPDVTVRHLPAPVAKVLARVVPQLNPELVDVLLRDSVTDRDPQETAARFHATADRGMARAQEGTRTGN